MLHIVWNVVWRILLDFMWAHWLMQHVYCIVIGNLRFNLLKYTWKLKLSLPIRMATKVEKRFPNKYLLLWWQIYKIVWDVDKLAWGNPLARPCHWRSSGHLPWHEWWVAKLQKRHVSSPHRVSPVCLYMKLQCWHTPPPPQTCSQRPHQCLGRILGIT